MCLPARGLATPDQNGGVDTGADDAQADDARTVAERYRRFAREEAPGRSDLYEEWARGVAADPATQRLLARIPASRRQPPLVFAVTRMLGAEEGDYSGWARWLSAHIADVARECVARGLQTNEPLRCAALLPALSMIEGPIALLELGASAGLCLFPDRYSYEYADAAGDTTRAAGGDDARRVRLDPVDGPSRVVLRSRLRSTTLTSTLHPGRSGQMPQLRMPTIVWRAGIDLSPLDAASELDRRFLVSLVWPGEQGRAARIRAALDIVAVDPPLLVRGDATASGVIAAVAASAPHDATLVVTTPGVLPHIDREGRERVFGALDDVRAERPTMRWISIDPPGLHERWAAPPPAGDGFVLGMDDRALARVDPLGGWVEWRAEDVADRR